MPRVEVGPYIQIRAGKPTPISGYIGWRGARPKQSWAWVLLWLLLLYLLLHAWDNPKETSGEWGSFLADIGHFLVRLVKTAGIFIAGLLSH